MGGMLEPTPDENARPFARLAHTGPVGPEHHGQMGHLAGQSLVLRNFQAEPVLDDLSQGFVCRRHHMHTREGTPARSPGTGSNVPKRVSVL